MKNFKAGQTVCYTHEQSTTNAVAKVATINYVVDNGRGLILQEKGGREYFMLTDFMVFDMVSDSPK